MHAVDLFAQVADLHLYHIGGRVKDIAPYRLENQFPTRDFTCVPRQHPVEDQQGWPTVVGEYR